MLYLNFPFFFSSLGLTPLFPVDVKYFCTFHVFVWPRLPFILFLPLQNLVDLSFLFRFLAIWSFLPCSHRWFCLYAVVGCSPFLQRHYSDDLWSAMPSLSQNSFPQQYCTVIHLLSVFVLFIIPAWTQSLEPGFAELHSVFWDHFSKLLGWFWILIFICSFL